MNIGTIVALGIIILSIIGIVAVAFITYKKVKPTLENINETNELITQKTKHFKREGEYLTQNIDHINHRITFLQNEIEDKSAHFKDLADENGKLQTSMRFLKDHSTDYAKGISSNLVEEVKEDGPKIRKIFKKAFKKTYAKQKIRINQVR